MQKHVNLVDLVKSFPTNIYLQNLASIQKRTSPVKFAHLAEKSGKGSISNLSTKVCVGAYMMEAPKSVYPDGPPPVSPAVACTMNLCFQYFGVYLGVAIIQTCAQISNIGYNWQNLQKNCKFLAGSFSAVSKRNFERKYAFDSIFQALQTTKFAYFCTSAISKFSQKIGLKNQQFS